VGRVEKVKFKSSMLEVQCIGYSSYLQDYHLSKDEGNFIISTGYVIGDPTDYQGVDVAPDEDDTKDFTWEPNFSLWADRDIGVVFQDTRNSTSTIWDVSSISSSGTNKSVSGDVADTQADDADNYSISDDNGAAFDAALECTLTDTPNKILSTRQINNLSIALTGSLYCHNATGEGVTITISLWNDDGSVYDDVGTIAYKGDALGVVPIGIDNYLGDNPFIIPNNPSDYLYDSGAAGGDRDTIKIKFTFSGTGTQATLYINYLAITIVHEDPNNNPIMTKLYGNDAETLYLTNGIYEGSTGWTDDGTSPSPDFHKGHAGVKYYDEDGEEKKQTGLNGTSEVLSFWLLVDNAACDFTVWFDDTGNSEICSLHNNGGNFQFQSGDGNTDCGAITANQWYWCKITYVQATNDVSFHLDGVAKVTTENGKVGNNVDDVYIQKTATDGHTLYIDAPILGISNGDGLSSGDNEEPTGGIACYTAGIRNGDYFMTGYNTKMVLLSLSLKIPNLTIDVDPNFDKYFPRNMRGKSAYQVLTAICELEDASWYEEYDSSGNCIIGVRKRTGFDNSDYKDNSHAITTSNYEWNFEIEREYNHYKGVRVFGNSNFDIDVYVGDTETNTSDRVYKIIDEGISTEGEAYEVAYEKLQTLKTIRPSIRLTVKDAYVQQLDAGKDVTFTCARPTLTGTYPIRRITYYYGFPLGKVWAEVYLGLGESPPQEKLANQIQKGVDLAHRIQTDKLNPSNIIGTPAFSHSSLSNVTTSQHHVKYTDAEAVTAMGAKGDANPLNHDRYTDAEAVTAMGAKADANPLNHDIYEFDVADLPNYIIEGAVPYGSGNDGYWKKATYTGHSGTTYLWRVATGNMLTSTANSTAWLTFECTSVLETSNYHFVITGIRIFVDTASATDYVDRCIVWRTTSTTEDSLDDDSTNRTSSGEYSYVVNPATSCQNYEGISIALQTKVVSGANSLKVKPYILIKGYWDDN